MNPERKEPRSGKLSVVVPVYSGDAYLAGMFRSLFLDGLRRNAGRRIELVIVDDASPLRAETERAAEEASAWADVVYHRNPGNLGYLASANKGLALSSGGYVLLCNSDTRLAPGALDRLLDALREPATGIAGPMTNGAFNSLEQLAGDTPAPLASFEEAELLRFDSYGAALAARGRPAAEAGWLIGFCMLLKREMLEDVGLFDESFGYGYLEELDYAIRARKAGWKLAVAPDAFVFHGGLRSSWSPAGPNSGSQTGRAFPVRTFFRISRGLWRIVRKYGWGAVGLPQDPAEMAKRGF